MRSVSRITNVCFFIFTLSALMSLVPSRAFAQSNVNAASSENRPSAGGPRRQLATIIYSGLGGAVLGLSTLSFYGRPQDKLSNIAVGFAVGVITGTIVVTYNAATNPDEFYGVHPSREELLGPAPSFSALASREPQEASDLGFSFSIFGF
jgi:hypothetical protein